MVEKVKLDHPVIVIMIIPNRQGFVNPCYQLQDLRR
jgi:hypothetical protein